MAAALAALPARSGAEALVHIHEWMSVAPGSASELEHRPVSASSSALLHAVLPAVQRLHCSAFTNDKVHHMLAAV